jgi:hypothetical protein
MATHDRALAKYSRNFVNGAISESSIAKEEYGDAISNILSQGTFKDLDGITEAIKETLDPKELAQEYASRFGYYA